jgi:hypothetical protein
MSSACGTLSKDSYFYKLFALSCNQHTRRDGLRCARCPAAGQATQCKRRNASGARLAKYLGVVSGVDYEATM